MLTILITFHSGCTIVQIFQTLLVDDELLDAFPKLTFEILYAVHSFMDLIDISEIIVLSC
jgi:hypothetical protein